MEDRTKIIFAKALKNIMKHKDFKAIRINDLCEEAGASRRTFYYHFEDKYDLINWLLYEELWNVANGKMCNVLSQKDHINALKIMKNDYSFYRKICKDLHVYNILGEVIAVSEKSFDDNLKKVLNKDMLSKEMYDDIHFFTLGLVYSTCEWVINGCKETPKELSDRLIRSFPEWIKPYIIIDL